jgi:hypothetical protein
MYSVHVQWLTHDCENSKIDNSLFISVRDNIIIGLVVSLVILSCGAALGFYQYRWESLLSIVQPWGLHVFHPCSNTLQANLGEYVASSIYALDRRS